jgi:hypothetical protein
MASPQFKYVYKIIPDAYHGTGLETAKKIVKDNRFHHSHNDRYLGKGIYFFESALARAIKWAEDKFKKGQIGVIKAIINLGSCLDLTNPENINLLIRLKKKLIQEKKLTSITNAYVINVCAKINNVDTVRAPFYKGDWREDFHNIELIICVRNNASIMGMSLIYEGVIR